MPARILVVEDNEDSLDLMTYVLKAFGHTVLVARDGEEGLEVARREIPDLIVSDLQMPKLDGYNLARALRKDARLAALPLVAVTSFAMRGDRERVLAAGFDGYITKPIAPEEFVGRVESFLRAAQHSNGRPEPAPMERLPAPVPFHTTILAVDNSAVNLNLIHDSLAPFGYEVLFAQDVPQALAMALDHPPDLILSDLHMPEQDGCDFFRAVRNEPKLRNIPFVIISSTVWGDHDVKAALGIGVDRFLLRPIGPRQLMAEIETCIAECRTKYRKPTLNEPEG